MEQQVMTDEQIEDSRSTRSQVTMAENTSPVIWNTHAATIHHNRSKTYRWAKRAFDLVAALVLLMVLTPILLVIALAIKLDSSGKVIYEQERVGYDEETGEQRTFVIRKFRSMYDKTDDSLHRDFVKRWINGKVDPEKEKVKIQNDPRVTRVGHLLRRTSLDELPQLWNVLKGDMSLVGPRPVPIYEVEEYSPWHRHRLEAIPGLTGLWQVKGRGQVTVDKMAELDIEYIEHRSFWLDLKILIMTIPAIVSGRGAE
jgi:lipopolysaccharide/colanic/teichoic acid biosynthesis glycosyltransferase